MWLLFSYRLLFTQWILRFRCVRFKNIHTNGFQLFSVIVIEIFTHHAYINSKRKCLSLSSYRVLFTQWILRIRCVRSKKITTNGFQLFSVIVIEIFMHHTYISGERKCMSFPSYRLLFTQWILSDRCERSAKITTNGFQLFCSYYRDLHASCIHQWRAQMCVPFFI